MIARWSRARVAADGSHHCFDGEPLYARRWIRVGKFHAPGLAPATGAGGALHIDESGEPAYTLRYAQTFGFYEGLAAVEAADGWYHIHVDGAPAYASRWAWCGNVQEGRVTVRGADGRYQHLDAAGRSVGRSWAYAGDFKDGIAVVQGDDGQSTHVDREGKLVHGRWFRDLDVFHKGWARAKDEGGWTHVDGAGVAAYDRRFVMVEPFYNGQARVERFDGGLEVIDETGRPLIELRPGQPNDLHAVSAELVSFWRCESIFAAIEVGIFERLPLADATAPIGLSRLLGALAELGLVEMESGAWKATPRGALLRGDHPRSLAAAARYWSSEGRRAWRQLGTAISDPDWRATDPFLACAGDPAAVRALHEALAPYAAHDYARIAEVIDGGHRVVIDAGGATGSLARALVQARPELTALVLDRPEVVALAREEQADRVQFVAGDLFGDWGIRGDAVVLARVLHDWPDSEVLEILRRARGALLPGRRLYVVELLRDPASSRGGLLSLHLLLATGGQERTRGEYETLLGLAGFRAIEVRNLPSVSDVIVAERA